MMKLWSSILLLLFCIGYIDMPGYAAGSFIVKDNKSEYTIILPEDPAPAEKTAASELSEHIYLMTGVRIPVSDRSNISPSKSIFIDRNHSLPSDLDKYKKTALSEEEILIASSKDGSVLICGSSPRGTLYAVYEYLHRLGVRFYTPTFTKYPSAVKKLSVPSYYRYRPPAYARSMSLGNDAPAVWYARNRMNSIALWGDLPVEYGSGKPEGPDMHTFWRYVPVGVFDEHPDWAAMSDGKRLPPAGNANWGMCLNPEARSYLADRAVEWSERHPAYSTVWMGINDGSPYCTCQYCTDFYKKHGGQPSSLVMQLVNEVAERLPGKLVKTLAYGWTIDPPENFKLRDNVVVMFCAQADPHSSIPKGPSAKVLADRLSKWQKVAKNIAVYLYPFPSDNYWFPSPSLYPGAESIRWASDSGITELYAQISGFGGSRGSESLDLRAWVYARMMWNPKSDPKALVREFCKDNYTVAAGDVIKVIDLLHSEHWKKSAAAARHSFALPGYVDPVGVSEANAVLEKAYIRFGEKDQAARDRFEAFWIAYLWADVWSGFEGLGKYDDSSQTWMIPMKNGETGNRRAVLAKSLMAKHGVNGLSEMLRINPSQLSIDRYGSKWPAVKLDDGKTSLVVVAGISGNITDWKDKASGFAPLKEAWFFTLMQYPLFAAWRDQIDGEYIKDYKIVSKSAVDTELKGSASGMEVSKKVSIADGTVSVTLGHTGTGKTLSTVMMDMNDNVFGTSPVVYVLQNDASWTKSMPSDGLGDFWYSYKPVDISSAAGKLAILDSVQKKGVLFEWDKNEVESVAVEYDRYLHPADLGKMLQLAITAKPATSLTIKARILNSVDMQNWK